MGTYLNTDILTSRIFFCPAFPANSKRLVSKSPKFVKRFLPLFSIFFAKEIFFYSNRRFSPLFSYASGRSDLSGEVRSVPGKSRHFTPRPPFFSACREPTGMEALPAKHQKASQKRWKPPGRTARPRYPGSCG